MASNCIEFEPDQAREERVGGLVQEYLRNRDQARERQRKHEATHGWRNPPSIYEESET